MTYQEQLLTLEWSELRFKILVRDLFMCQFCDSHNMLNVHHLFYIKNRMAWEYNQNMLITLCSIHHKLEHKSLLILKDYNIKEQLTSGMLAMDIIIKINEEEQVYF
jgi:5-methylcytosine-specific restriction endonuclease McrA